MPSPHKFIEDVRPDVLSWAQAQPAQRLPTAPGEINYVGEAGHGSLDSGQGELGAASHT